jgi:hypothetical protein
MFSTTGLILLWLSGILLGHFTAVWFDKQDAVEALLRSSSDIGLNSLAESGKLFSIFLQHFGRTCIIISEYLGEWVEQSLNYIGSSLVSTLVFAGSAIAQSVTFTGSTISSMLTVTGTVLSHSLDYAGTSISSTIIFVLDVMEKLASTRIVYTFIFILSIYLLWRFPGSLRNGVQSMFSPIQEGVVEVWRTSTRAVFILWSSMNLSEVLKFVLLVILLFHFKNNMFC